VSLFGFRYLGGLFSFYKDKLTPPDPLECSRILSLYQSPSLLEFWRSILKDLNQEIFLSNDPLGSVYGLIIPPGGSPGSVVSFFLCLSLSHLFVWALEGNWHVDEHSFSCVFMLQKPTEGFSLLLLLFLLLLSLLSLLSLFSGRGHAFRFLLLTSSQTFCESFSDSFFRVRRFPSTHEVP